MLPVADSVRREHRWEWLYSSRIDIRVRKVSSVNTGFLASNVTFKPLSITLVADIGGERYREEGDAERNTILRFDVLHIRSACTQPPGCVRIHDAVEARRICWRLQVISGSSGSVQHIIGRRGTQSTRLWTSIRAQHCLSLI